jgi:RsiW-degrading membrane proteinase PrsW (M82 family)
MTNTQGRDFVSIYLNSSALTVVAVAPAAAAMTYYRWSPDAPLSVVLAAVAMGVAAWFFMLIAVCHPLADEGRLLLSRLLPTRFA